MLLAVWHPDYPWHIASEVSNLYRYQGIWCDRGGRFDVAHGTEAFRESEKQNVPQGLL